MFKANYVFDNITNPNNISSDVRYAYVEKNGVKALVIQFTKVRFGTDTTVEKFNSYLNFQTWLFENGNIEMRFGESNLDNCPNYVPGEGFYTIIDDTAYLTGPTMGMLHYSEPEQTGIGMFGTYDDFYVEYDGTGYIKTMPPEGWVIRFKKKDMTAAQSNLAETIKVYPNPAKDYFQLNSQLPIQRIDIISLGGKILKSYSAVGSQDKIPVNELLPGLKYLRLYTQNGVIHKILIIAK